MLLEENDETESERLPAICFDSDTGEELGSGNWRKRMIVIEWSEEKQSVVYYFQNWQGFRTYCSEEFEVSECPTWDTWHGWGLPPYEYVLENYALEHARQNYAA